MSDVNEPAVVSSDRLTTGEAALYDRQLRLWGVDAQRRLRSSRIFIFGVSSLTGEVAKNLILAGVNRVTLVDSNDVVNSDVSSSFFVSEEDLGKNRAASFCANLTVLNPLVKVDAFAWQPSQSGEVFCQEDFFKKFPTALPQISQGDVVIINGLGLAVSAAIASECRKMDACCYVTGVIGALGCFFVDLGEDFSYRQSDDAQITNFQRNNVGTEQTTRFPALSTVLLLNPSLKRNDLVTTDTPSGQRYFSLSCSLLRHVADGDNLAAEDKVLLDVCGEDSAEVVTDSSVTPLTSSIVGGILAQEIVKNICRNAPPINNFFFMDTTRFFSLIDCVRSPSHDKRPTCPVMPTGIAIDAQVLE